MFTLVRLLFLPLMLLYPGQRVISQSRLVEICNNSLDDDNDGRIDLNDQDCDCPLLETTSLLPNHSFEAQDCCPSTHSMVVCATGWLPASATTPDYFHPCDWMANGALPIPMPIPDGEGFIGIIDGSFSSDPNPDWKEYIGACLEDSLQIDSIYRLRIHVGFLSRRTSPATDIVVYGTGDCTNLPFGEGDTKFGCPTNGPGWVRLGSVSVAGQNEWKPYEFLFTVNSNITGIIIGPNCAHRSLSNDPYYLLDKVVLAKDSDFEVDIKANGTACDPDLTFRIPHRSDFSYQWYKNGVAIIGATDAVLHRPPGPGQYQVKVENAEGCQVSAPFNHSIPFQTTRLDRLICPGEALVWNDRTLSAAGTYRDTFKAINNCDSIVQVDLRLEENIESRVSVKIFPFESYQIGSFRFDAPGDYVQTIPSAVGCDSTVLLNISHYSVHIPNVFSPNGDGVNDIFSIRGTQDLRSVASLKIFDRWGNLVFNSVDLAQNAGWNGEAGGKAAPAAVYVYAATLLMDDGLVRTVSGTVTLIR